MSAIVFEYVYPETDFKTESTVTMILVLWNGILLPKHIIH